MEKIRDKIISGCDKTKSGHKNGNGIFFTFFFHPQSKMEKDALRSNVVYIGKRKVWYVGREWRKG